jgi:hypothetical protein
MRLRDIQHILQNEEEALSPPVGQRQGAGIGNVKPLHKGRIRAALQELTKVAPFATDAEALLKHAALREPGEPALVLEDVVNQFVAQAAHLRGRVSDLLATINAILPEEKPLSFAYQLPDADRDMEALEEELSTLKLIIDEPLVRLTGARTQLEALDRGTIVIELVAATAAGVTIVALLCKAARTLLDTRHRYRLQELQYDSLSLDLEHKANVVAANKAALAQVSRKLATGISASAGKDQDNEATNLVQVSIERLSEKMEHGAKVLVAGNAPDDVKELMPPEDDTPLLPEVVIKELAAINPAAKEILTVDLDEDLDGEEEAGSTST